MLYGVLANESESYRAARAELRQAEIALRDQREKVAELRRQLPLDTEVEDYLFHEGPRDLNEDGPISEVRLSELFDKPEQPLVVYQFMYGVAQENPCPSCTMWTEGLDGVAHHLAQQVNFAVIAAADIEDWRAWGRKRGWRRVRLASCRARGRVSRKISSFRMRTGISIRVSASCRRGGGYRFRPDVSRSPRRHR